MAAQIKEFIDLVNNNGWLGWLIGLVVVTYKFGGPVVNKIWTFATSWFDPEIAERRRRERVEQAVLDEDRRIAAARERRAEERDDQNRLLDVIEESTKAQVQIVITLQQIQEAMNRNDSKIDTRLSNVEIDISAMYAYMQQHQPSRMNRQQTKPNTQLPRS